tara:strand:+ start:4046 stop:5425 length:1380 start_codon:yes stop_codon:yes gene_type:complete
MKQINKNFLRDLKRAYREVVESDQQFSASDIRIQCAENINAAFDCLNYEIKGSENLPNSKGSIFIYNHLLNHDYLTVDTNFQLTLDSHFISSKIVHTYYNTPGIRIVRHALPDETNHKSYYDKLDYIKVYSKAFTPPNLDKLTVKKAHEAFRLETIENLEQQIDVVFNPEGSSHTTENSPGSFWLGIFKLAASMKEQPYIVPLVMTGFDKLPSEAVYKCQIMPPFKMSEYGIQSSEDPLIKGVIENLNIRYKTWVTELNKKDTHFTSEISALEKKIKHKHNTKNLVVFYGSSSIRLWKTIENDFKSLNVLNLGFGGAYIESLSHHFESLFTFEAPKAIVLYLGGNDLNLGYSAKKIVALIKKFITVINRKFPNTLIFNISIKPSFERIDKLKTIETINQLMYDLSNEKNFFKHIDFYSAMMKNNTVDGRFLLQDGLHLNSDGYDVLRKLLKKAFKESIL